MNNTNDICKTYPIPFDPLDGTDDVILMVAYHDFFLRNNEGVCAFCHGDSLGKYSESESLIMQYHKRNRHAKSCPCCDGKAT